MNEKEKQQILKVMYFSQEKNREFIEHCRQLISKLIETEFKELKPCTFMVMYDRFKEEEKSTIAVIDGIGYENKERQTIGGHFVILLNSRLNINRWPDKRIEGTLRHELRHVQLKTNEHGPEFKKGKT